MVHLPPGARPITDTILAPIDNQITIALLLPLSGQNATLGRDLQNAAELALFDIRNPKLALVPLDTAGTGTGTIDAMNKAITARADIVLGPVFKYDTEAAIPIAAQHNIKLITFSNDTALAASGAYVFGFTPDEQIERVVEYAIQRGIHDFYVMAPDNGMDRATKSVLERLAAKYEFTVHENITYKSVSNQGVADGARKIAQKLIAARKEDGRQPKEQALILPEGGARLLEITNILAGFGLNANDVRLLGSGQWDDADIYKQRRMLGGWFASADPEQRALFTAHYKEVYGYEPVRIASIAYDAVALTGFLAASSGNRFSTSAIINERGFAGVDGVFRFNPGRISERSLAVMEIIPNGLEVVEPAPKTLPNFVQKY